MRRSDEALSAADMTPAEQAAWKVAVGRGMNISRVDMRMMLEAAAPAGADAQVEAVLDVLAPKADLPPGFNYADGVENLRVPVIYVEFDRRPVWPDDAGLRALAEQIVTAIRTASGG